jgi:hypothetical protein
MHTKERAKEKRKKEYENIHIQILEKINDVI